MRRRWTRGTMVARRPGSGGSRRPRAASRRGASAGRGHPACENSQTRSRSWAGCRRSRHHPANLRLSTATERCASHPTLFGRNHEMQIASPDA
jgi:hypothetical protein